MRRFLLIGSVAPRLMTHVAQSLAGRLSLVELTPFVFTELSESSSVADIWLRGGYPDGGVIHTEGFPPVAARLPTSSAARLTKVGGRPAPT